MARNVYGSTQCRYSAVDIGLTFFLACDQQIENSIPVNGAIHITQIENNSGLLLN